MDKTNSKAFQYLSKKFPKVITVKLKEGIFVGPQIREILEILTDTERAAWNNFKWACANF